MSRLYPNWEENLAYRKGKALVLFVTAQVEFQGFEVPAFEVKPKLQIFNRGRDSLPGFSAAWAGSRGLVRSSALRGSPPTDSCSTWDRPRSWVSLASSNPPPRRSPDR